MTWPDKQTVLFFSILLLSALAGMLYPTYAEAEQPKIQRLGGGRYLSETVRLIPTLGQTILLITGPGGLGGEIIITVGTVDSVRVEIAKILTAGSADAALLLVDAIDVDTEITGETLLLTLGRRSHNLRHFPNSDVKCNVNITVPRDWNIDIDIDIDGPQFDYDLDGPFRTVLIRTEFGRVKLNNVTEKTNIQGAHTAVELRNVRGVIAASTSYAPLIVTDAITSPDHPARFTNTSGSITITQLAGAVEATGDGAPLMLSDIVLVGSTSRLRCANAAVDMRIIEFSQARLEIENESGSVTLSLPKDVSARFQLATKGGGMIQTRGIELQTHRNLLSRGRVDGLAGDGNGIIDVKVTGTGRIEVRGI